MQAGKTSQGLGDENEADTQLLESGNRDSLEEKAGKADSDWMPPGFKDASKNNNNSQMLPMPVFSSDESEPENTLKTLRPNVSSDEDFFGNE